MNILEISAYVYVVVEAFKGLDTIPPKYLPFIAMIVGAIIGGGIGYAIGGNVVESTLNGFYSGAVAIGLNQGFKKLK